MQTIHCTDIINIIKSACSLHLIFSSLNLSFLLTPKKTSEASFIKKPISYCSNSLQKKNSKYCYLVENFLFVF